MANKKTEIQPISIDTLREEMKKFHRDEVLKILKGKTLNLTDYDDYDTICHELIELRDMRIVDCLSQQMEHFQVSMFDVDLDNGRNRDFINEVLAKHYKKFDLGGTQVRNDLFEIACKVGNTKLPAQLLKKDATREQYVSLAASSNTTFALLLNIKPASLDADAIVDILYAASLTSNAQNRMTQLMDAGYRIDTTNTAGDTVISLLEERIEHFSYSSNKKGLQNQQADKSTLAFLKHSAKDDPIAKKQKQHKIIIGCVIGGIALIAAVIVFSFWYQAHTAAEDAETPTTDSSSDSSDASSESDTSDTSTIGGSSDATDTYLSDTSLVVADGDTVNIDYTGYVDGVAFDGGSTNGAGTSLVIGSGSYIDDFEEQLVGHNVGDSVEVNVTFPDDYNNVEMQGKEATFDVTINGIYQ